MFTSKTFQAESAHKDKATIAKALPGHLFAIFLLKEGQYMVIGGVKRRHGAGTHTNGKEKYVGEWLNDSMHGQGSKRRVPRSFVRDRNMVLLYSHGDMNT